MLQVANVLGTESELSQTPPPSTVKQSRSAELPRETAEGLLTPDLTASIAELTICSSADSISSAPTLIVQPSKDLLTDFHLPKVSANDPKAQICFDFTKGVCTRGGSCKFSHDVALIVSVNSQERGICFDFLRGQCHRGLLCRFSHDLSSLAAQQCQVCPTQSLLLASARSAVDFVKVQVVQVRLNPQHCIFMISFMLCREAIGGMPLSAMTLSRGSVHGVRTAGTPMISTPSSTTPATPASIRTMHSYAMTTASKFTQVPLFMWFVQVFVCPLLSAPLHGVALRFFIPTQICHASPDVCKGACRAEICLLCRGRCARGAACRYSHDFSALTANPSLPALTAAAAAAAIAQMSIHSGGLLPHLALLQSHIPPAPQPIPLQQQLMFEHRNPTPPAPQPSIFNKAAFLQQASRNFR